MITIKHKVNGRVSCTNPEVQLPDICPICHSSIVPKVLVIFLNSELFNDSFAGASAALACPSCHQLFVACLNTVYDPDFYNLIDVAPKMPLVEKLDPALSEVSSQFIEIFNQASAAEAYGLEQICGIGYRKSLEFLIKDYSCFLHPDEADDIRAMPLSSCINKYIVNPKIVSTAKAATWIGNDETHYVRKWENKDISDLKKFIKACSYWILSDVASQEALDMINS